MGGKRRKKRKSKKRKGRPKGFSRLTRVQSKKQARYGHAICHSSSYQKSKPPKTVKREHDFLVRHYLKGGMKEHKTPM